MTSLTYATPGNNASDFPDFGATTQNRDKQKHKHNHKDLMYDRLLLAFKV